MILIETPSKARLVGYEGKSADEAKFHLTYQDKRVEYEYRKFRHATWYLNKYGEPAWREKLEELTGPRF